MDHNRSKLYTDILTLDRGEYTSCTVNLQGATVTSWRINDREQLFVSRYSHFTDLSRISGGIQFIFPVLGPWELGPIDGFAKFLIWSVEEAPARLESGDVYAVVTLRDNPYTRSLWNYKFKLSYKITLLERTISFHIAVENPSAYYPLEFIITQESWLRVSNVTACEIVGLQDCTYKDVLGDNEIHRDEGEIVKISERTHKIYVNTPNEVVLQNTVNGASMKIRKKMVTDIIVWNPWIEQSMTMEDIGRSID